MKRRTFILSVASLAALGSRAFGKERELLEADRTYHVRTDGSDLNSGLEDSPSGAFATWQHAINFARSLDLNGHVVTLQAGSEATDKTFIENILIGPMMGGGLVILDGGGRSTIKTLSGEAITLHQVGTTVIMPRNIRIESARHGIKVNYMSLLSLGAGVTFGDCGGNGIWVHDNQALAQILNVRLTIAGKMSSFLFMQYGHVFVEACTLDSEGAEFSSAFITMFPRGSAQFVGNKLQGKASGRRFYVYGNSVLNLDGVPAEVALPGDMDGISDASSTVNQ